MSEMLLPSLSSSSSESASAGAPMMIFGRAGRAAGTLNEGGSRRWGCWMTIYMFRIDEYTRHGRAT